MSADDFCRASADFSNYFENVALWYREHNGRFINSLFSYLPVYNPTVYKITLGLSMILFGGTIYFFLSRLFIFFQFKLRKDQVLFISVLFFIAIISLVPSVNELFYWYAGTSAYLYSSIFLLLLIIALINISTGSKIYALAAALLIILIIGNNELLLLLTNFLVGLLLLYSLFYNKKIRWISCLLLVISFISSLIVIFSPGSISRQAQYPEGGQFLSSLKMAFLSSGMFTLKTIIEPPVILLMAGIFLLLFYWGKNLKEIQFLNPFALLLISLISIASVVFVPYYATGYLMIRSGRIGNMIHIVWWIFLLINILNAVLYFRKKCSPRKIISKVLPSVSLTLFLILTLSGRTYKNLFQDFQNNEFERFEADIRKRTQTIRFSNSSILEVEKISGTRTISSFGISQDLSHWTNQCYLEAINKTLEKQYLGIIEKE
ncbi:hypothetical protein HC175_14080 [Salinimicrobium sp. CDJ15-91]|uniref:Uncharacterized protein n=1 Tax=Salinimicrobium oceani TaxID=2722702 RepID=A0ABX1D130_9FLAO|nr:hypothetical protein [Salinimicrobium oceani]